jgi:hypothetical protein
LKGTATGIAVTARLRHAGVHASSVGRTSLATLSNLHTR